MVLAIVIPPDEIADARWRARHFAIEWFGEAPLRLHSRSNSYGAAPDFTGEFSSYLEQALFEKRASKRQNRLDLEDDPRRRVTKAFRKLREKAPREFDAAYGMCVLDQVGRDLRANDHVGLQRQFEASLRRTKDRLNQRASGQRYTESDVLILTVSALRKLGMWAG